MQTQYVVKMDYIIDFLNQEKITGLIPFLRDSISVYIIFVILFVIILFLIAMFSRSNSKEKITVKERKQPNLDDIVETNKVNVSDDNEFVDVLVAIEEEMIAIRELYVGGYISKGVYISETDRLYEKAKIFGI